MGRRYETGPNGRAPGSPRLTCFDYGLWARCLPGSRPYREAIAYWRAKLAGVNARVELPAERRQKRDDANADLPLRFEPAVVDRLKALADQRGITLPPLLFALFLVWLWRLTDQEELACSYPYAGRDVPGSEEIYGMFVTMGILRQVVRPDVPLCDLAVAVHRQMLEDKDHLLASPYDGDIAGLDGLNVMFSLQSGIGLEGEIGGGAYKAQELLPRTPMSDLAGTFYQTADGAIEGRLEYDGALFDGATIAGFAECFSVLVSGAAHQPQARVGEVPYLSEAASARLLAFACGPPLDRTDQSIPARFREMVAAFPERPALVFAGRTHSYRELDSWSDRIAGYLASQLRPGMVGLSMLKSDALIATVLAILKLGRAYVPLDLGYPAERLRYFVENCALDRVVADAASAASLAAAGLAHVATIDPLASTGPAAPPAEEVSPHALAYNIHTSGSTGKPKGVMVEHRTVVRMILGSALALDFTPECVAMLLSSMNFDASVAEIFVPLLSGGCLVVASEEVRKDPVLVHRAMREHGVTHADMTPALLRSLPRQTWPALRVVGFGGDTIDEQTAAWWSRQTRLFSYYGPTEVTVQSSIGQVVPGGNHAIIGKPLPGYRMYLLNRQRQLVPPGAIGEICIGGDGLARGYLNRPDLTLERFITDPLGGSPYAMMYVTGDLGRYLPDGTIVFHGRNDFHIKLRGFRIELGEIETCLGTFPGVRQVVCATKGEGENLYLAAYLVSDGELDEAALRHQAGRELPDYMVPSFFVRLDSLPVTPNGKIDRKALPDVVRKAAANPPETKLERDIAAVWEELLHFQGIGRDESFFHVGGNSLLAVRLQFALRERLGLEFTLSEFYARPTIEALTAGDRTAHVQEAVRDATTGVTVAEPATAPARMPPRSVLLTGASGFLGIFLLAELTRRVEVVHCLELAADEAQGREAIRRQAQAARLEIELGRVRVLSGDLAKLALGLSADERSRLAGDVDAILHCGAFVHHLHSYHTMKAANVDGTAELLRLALEGTRKPFCYVSTLSVATWLSGEDMPHESIVTGTPRVDNGYVLTKWVSEHLVARCAARYGLPAVIARPGNITGASDTGFSNYADNHFWLFVRGCLQLGAFPDKPERVEMMPVDVVARAIAALALAPRERLLVANLCNPRQLSERDFFARLADNGCVAAPEEPRVWQGRLAALPEGNSLAQIKDFYSGDLMTRPPAIEQGATLAALAESGIEFGADYDALVPTYVSYLRGEQFFP